MLLLIIRKKAYMLPPLAIPRGKLSPVRVPVKDPVCMSILSHHPPRPPTGGPVTPEQASCWLLSNDLQKCDPAFTARLKCPSQIESVAPSFGPGDTCLLWTGCLTCVALVSGVTEFSGVAQALTQDEGWECVAQRPPAASPARPPPHRPTTSQRC